MRRFSLLFNILLKPKGRKEGRKRKITFNLLTINIYHCFFEIIYLHCQGLYHLSEKKLLKDC
jgi:hypothetical protein